MAAMVQDLWQGFRDSEKRMLVHLLAKLRLNLLSLEALDDTLLSTTDVAEAFQPRR
jgi:hypothetical protein